MQRVLCSWRTKHSFRNVWLNKQGNWIVNCIYISSAIKFTWCFLSRRRLPDWLTAGSKNEKGFSIKYEDVLEFILATGPFRSRGSQCSVWLRTGRPGFDPRQRLFPLAFAFRPVLGPTQPPVQWVPGVLSPGVKRGRGVMLTTHPHLVPRLSMSRSYTSSHPKRLHGV
jgi:hypothetical protein